MTREEFNEVIHREGLDKKYHVNKTSQIELEPLAHGCAYLDAWVVYQIDGHREYHEFSRHNTESEGLAALLEHLRDAKRKEDRLEKFY